MDWGIIATVIGGVIAALFTWRGVRDKNKTDTRAAELDKLLAGLGSEIDRLKADVESLKTVLAATTTDRKVRVITMNVSNSTKPITIGNLCRMCAA